MKGKVRPGGVATFKQHSPYFFRANDARQDVEWQHQSESIYLMESIAHSFFCALDNPSINRGINSK